jgi:hypothetical protein
MLHWTWRAESHIHWEIQEIKYQVLRFILISLIHIFKYNRGPQREKKQH